MLTELDTVVRKPEMGIVFASFVTGGREQGHLSVEFEERDDLPMEAAAATTIGLRGELLRNGAPRIRQVAHCQ